ncbi:MAG: neutral/alkaline non-lysosomal ceramidase N-terminal domain-containing protein [Planctomyces sp.]|jgi:neutral ceramidase
MHWFRRTVAVLLIGCALWSWGSGVLAGELRAGAATSVVTPAIGGDIVGGFQPIPSTHIHDELHVRCLVLDDGTNRIALVVCDLLGLHRCVSDEARKQIQQRLGIPAEHVLISATHTHSAVSALGSVRYAIEAEPDEYQRFVISRIVDGVQRAVNLLRPAELAFGTVEAGEHVFNRRWHMRDGYVAKNPFGGVDRVKMNPPAGSAQLDRPAGPVDPVVSVLSVREPGGAPIAVYAAYSLHYVGGVGNGHISADYFGMFCEALSRRHGTGEQPIPFVAMLANGTSGDVNNINFRTPRPAAPAYQQMRLVAEDVADKVHGILGGLKYRRELQVAGRMSELTVGWRIPTAEQLAWAAETLSQPEGLPGQADLPRIYAGRVRSLEGQPERAAVPLQVLRIGDVRVGTMPCEVFCEIGLEYRRRVSAGGGGFLVSLAHGYYGYLPTAEQHLLGGYETWLGTNRLAADAAGMMLDELERIGK